MSLSDRFWAKVNKTSTCWNWTGSKAGGYGRIYFNKKIRWAHRISWYLTFGQMPKLLVCHSCDNPSCVNPSHLFLGSQSSNIKDSARKGRHYHGAKTHCNRGHKYTKENTLIYPLKKGGYQRECRTCRRKVWH